MAKVQGAVIVDKEGCKGCGVCVENCPQEVLALHKEVNSRGYHYSYMADPDACTGCSNCGLVCPDTCLTIYRARRA